MPNHVADPHAIRLPEEIPYRSAKFANVLRLALALADSAEPLLILGELGVGKTSIAGLVHHRGRRRLRKSHRWGIIPCEIRDPRLYAYGSVRGGNPPGIEEERPGIFAECDGGTILFDGLPWCPLDQQELALEVIERQAILPVGASRPVPVDLRFIFVATGDMERWVRKGRVLHALFRRLMLGALSVPPLRQRREDIRPSFFHVLERVPRGERPLPTFTEDALRYVESLELPANAWDLNRLAHAAALRAPGETLTREGVEAFMKEFPSRWRVPWKRAQRAPRSDAGPIHPLTEGEPAPREMTLPRSGSGPTAGPATVLAGRSPFIAEFTDFARRVGRFTRVLLIGEPGSGLTTFARYLHEAGSRREERLVFWSAPECAEGPDGPRLGGPVANALRALGRGTLVIEGIERLSPGSQRNLLDYLNEGALFDIHPPTWGLDVGVVGTTTRHGRRDRPPRGLDPGLWSAFPFVFRVPPLRERREDISILARTFARAAGRELGKGEAELSPPAVAFLERQPWRGNVRELVDVVGLAVARMTGLLLHEEGVALAMEELNLRSSRAAAP